MVVRGVIGPNAIVVNFVLKQSVPVKEETTRKDKEGISRFLSTFEVKKPIILFWDVSGEDRHKRSQ